jgi:DNA-binding LacI/PurR family transcriptional regulator
MADLSKHGAVEQVPRREGQGLRRSRATIREVALQARVGVGTVSRVLNDSRHVSPETRRHVLEAIERLSFRPDRTARGLVKGRTQTIGVLVPFFTKHYYLEILRGAEQASSRADHSLIVYDVERVEQAREHLDFLARNRRVDGLIVIALDGSLITEAFDSMPPFPLVGVDTRIEGSTNLIPDHETGMYLAVRHLARLGHKRIVLIDQPQDPVSGAIDRSREDGYRRACREAGFPASHLKTVIEDYSREGGYRAARSLLTLVRRPTAFACASDIQATGVLQAVREQGLRVPADVAVTGYHDVELAQHVGLTTVRMPAFEMGRASVDVLLETLAAGRPGQPPALSRPELVVRETSQAGDGLAPDRYR